MTIMRVNVSKTATVAVGAAALALALTGCGQSGQSGGGEAQAPSAPPTSSAPHDTTSPATVNPREPGTSAPNSPASARNRAQEPALCTSSELRLSLGQGDAAAGTHYRPLQFTNAGSVPCVIQGFPGVSYVTGDEGRQVGPAAEREGAKGAAITLNPGEAASADVGFVQVQNYDASACNPTEVRGLRVYPPQETQAMFVEAPGTGCDTGSLPGNQLTVSTIK
ncbi:DUF4232 domain-containing protein [Saccharomonospora sp. NPDC006951]